MTTNTSSAPAHPADTTRFASSRRYAACSALLDSCRARMMALAPEVISAGAATLARHPQRVSEEGISLAVALGDARAAWETCEALSAARERVLAGRHPADAPDLYDHFARELRESEARLFKIISLVGELADDDPHAFADIAEAIAPVLGEALGYDPVWTAHPGPWPLD